jgi:hypothetical protein
MELINQIWILQTNLKVFFHFIDILEFHGEDWGTLFRQNNIILFKTSLSKQLENNFR